LGGFALAILLAAGSAGPGVAQADVAPGERVRIRQIEGPTVTGTLVDVSASELRLTTQRRLDSGARLLRA